VDAAPEAPARDSAYSKRPLKTAASIKIEWTDADGNLFQPGSSVSLPEIVPLSNEFPELGQSLPQKEHECLHRVAAQVVSVLEVPW
jgi:hypothetical protein